MISLLISVDNSPLVSGRTKAHTIRRDESLDRNLSPVQGGAQGEGAEPVRPCPFPWLSAVGHFHVRRWSVHKIVGRAVKKMADFFGVEIPEKKPEPEATDSVVAVTQTGGEGMGGVVARGYCPNCHCPSNIPYVVEGRLFYRPNRVLASPTGGVRCTQCGEILEMRCPVCGAPLNDGACCAVCGGAYVTPVLPEGVDPSAYARARRDEMLQLKALMQA